MANPRSKARLEARIHERVAHCIEFELSDPRSAFVTVTKVELTSDLSVARIFYSVYGTEGDKSRVKHMLEGASGYVRTKVAKALRVRRAPSIAWEYDDSIEYAARMDAAIRDALAHDREVNPNAHGDVDLTRPEPTEAELLDREYLDFLRAQEGGDEGEDSQGEPD
jgi:ribosome-binding factor A